jgi:hypothetical protein
VFSDVISVLLDANHEPTLVMGPDDAIFSFPLLGPKVPSTLLWLPTAPIPRMCQPWD